MLPAEVKIHLVFHVSQLKQHIGSTKTQSQLPLLDDQGLLVKEPVYILDRRMVKKQSSAVTKVLVKWCNTFPEDSTWESYLSAIIYKSYQNIDKIIDCRPSNNMT